MRLFTQLILCFCLANSLQASHVEIEADSQPESRAPNKYVTMAKTATAYGAIAPMAVIFGANALSMVGKASWCNETLGDFLIKFDPTDDGDILDNTWAMYAIMASATSAAAHMMILGTEWLYNRYQK